MIILLDIDLMDGGRKPRIALDSFDANRLRRAMADLRRLVEKEQDEREAEEKTFRTFPGDYDG